jgi:hypothetical protein
VWIVTQHSGTIIGNLKQIWSKFYQNIKSQMYMCVVYIDTFSFKGVKVSMLGFSTVDQGSAVGSYKDYTCIVPSPLSIQH